ncbi:MAG: FecR family protein [Candidatus Cryptobacteroides sp.]
MQNSNRIVEKVISIYRAGAFDPEAGFRRYISAVGNQTAQRTWKYSRTMAWLAAAAAVVLAIFIPILTSGPRLVEYAATDRNASIVLPEGTEVMLACGSSISFDRKSFKTERRVSLEGKAVFTVIHDSARPFAVSAGKALVRDLGTEFQIDYHDGLVEVDVFDGEVLFSGAANPEEGIRLTGGMHACLDSHQEVPVQTGTGVLNPKAWSDGRFVYEDAPVGLVLKDLERCYGTVLEASDTSASLTGTFTASSLDEIIRIIGIALDIEIKPEER